MQAQFARTAKVLVGLIIALGNIQIQTMASTQYVNINSVLCWLSADTQSLLVTNGPFKLPNAADITDEQMPHRKAAESIPLLAVLPAAEMSSQKFYPTIAGRRIHLAVEALGQYPQGRDPNILSRGLFIVCFEKDEDWDKVVIALSKRASSTSLYQRLEVFAFSEPSDFSRPDRSERINMYVCSPKPELLMISASLSELHNALDRMREHATTQIALPKTLPEWKYVDETAQFWAIRHCEKQSDDPTLLPPDAIGIGVVYRRSDDIVEITYLSTDDRFDMLRAFGQTWRIPINVTRIGTDRSFARINWKNFPGFPTPLYSLLGHVIPAL